MLETLRSVLRFGPITTDRVERRLNRCANVGDLREEPGEEPPVGGEVPD